MPPGCRVADFLLEFGRKRAGNGGDVNLKLHSEHLHSEHQRASFLEAALSQCEPTACVTKECRVQCCGFGGDLPDFGAKVAFLGF